MPASAPLRSLHFRQFILVIWIAGGEGRELVRLRRAFENRPMNGVCQSEAIRLSGSLPKIPSRYLATLKQRRRGHVPATLGKLKMSCLRRAARAWSERAPPVRPSGAAPTQPLRSHFRRFDRAVMRRCSSARGNAADEILVTREVDFQLGQCEALPFLCLLQQGPALLRPERRSSTIQRSCRAIPAHIFQDSRPIHNQTPVPRGRDEPAPERFSIG